MSNYHRMPNGEVTTSIEEYFDAWRQEAAGIAERTGLRLEGFDPGFLFSDGHRTIDLPRWFVRRFNHGPESDPAPQKIDPYLLEGFAKSYQEAASEET
jgi:hypothetical protein